MERGFTFLEVLVVTAMLSVLFTVLVPQAMLSDLERRQADKIIQELKLRMDAARLYYLQYKSWPSSWTALKNAGILPSSVSDTCFGNPILLSSTSSTFKAGLYINNSRVRSMVQQALPGGYVSASNKVYGVVPVPGNEVALEGLKNDILDFLKNWELKNIKLLGIQPLDSGANFSIPKPSCKQNYSPKLFVAPLELITGGSPILYYGVNITTPINNNSIWQVTPYLYVAAPSATPPKVKLIYFTTCSTG